MEETALLNVTEEDMNDSADRLEIDIEEDDIDPESRTPKRKRTDTSDSSDDEDALPENCLQIEEKVCKTAAKNHLSHSNVKNILKRVVSNEHVLAIVKLQEEEMQDAETSTITRSKAKKLMKTTPTPSWSLPMTPVKMPQLTSPEVTSLIAQDLPDEESDEEYQPNPDEHSDDENDTIGSLSDVDSQPRTPATPGQLNNELPESPSTKWTDDGLFKLPKIVTPVKEKEVTTEATIALRTRSKLCLSDTPIETIEESFIPPDITEDMYDFGDCGLDHDWKNFLADFTKPLPQAHEDDDEADPEYNADADKQTCELNAAEELRQDRALKVTRKELKDLVAELFEFDDIFDVQEAVMAGPNSNLVPTVVSQSESLIHTNADYSGKFMDLSKTQTSEEYSVKHLSVDQYNAQLSVQNSEMQMAGALLDGNQNPSSQVPLQIDVGSEPCSISADKPNGLLKTKPKPNTHIIMFNEKDWIYKDSDANLGQMQRDILDQQMRQHVQIATQCFLQLHGHPDYWKHGPQQLEYLMSLKYLSLHAEESAFRPCNLDNAIKVCEDWQAKLAEDTEEMRSMMKFIKAEILKSKRRRSQHSFYACKFPHQFFDAIVDSNVFIYPELLPSIPFRVEQKPIINYTYLKSEDHLISIGLSQFYQYIYANKELFPGFENSLQYRRVTELISKYLTPTMTPARLKGHIRMMKSPKAAENPIWYYYTHHKPPETKHRILSFGPHCTPRDHHKDLLPYLWRKVMYPKETRKEIPDDRPPMQARNVSKTTVANSTPKHRLAMKMQKELDANRAMFTTNRYADNLRDTLFATAYFERVQTRLNSNQEKNGSNPDSDQFLLFQNELDLFDPLKKTPCDLYNKLKKLFGSQNADLTDEFLAFLTAGQATEIGRFMDHFLLVSMAEFIERLQIYFERKPAQLRKVLWCLERLVEDVDNSENGEISMETVKSTILPHLKSSQYLVDWFLKLFPGEKPPESYANNGYEVLDIERMAKDYVEDQSSEDLDHEVLNVPLIEENYGNDLCTCLCHNSSDPKYQSRVRHCIPCGMKYMQGRVYIQHGRGLRAAHVTWSEGEGESPSGHISLIGTGMAAQARRLSAPATRVTRKRAASLDPPQARTDSDDERVSPKRILRFLRTPTSKNKFSKSVPCAKNLNKSLDNAEGSNVANKPSCSKSIMKDVEKLDSVRSGIAECLAEALPEPPCDHEELTIFNDSDRQISLLAASLKGERTDPEYVDASQSGPQDECESECLDVSTVSERESLLANDAPYSVSSDFCSPSERDRVNYEIKKEPTNNTHSNTFMPSQSIKAEDESNWTRDEDKVILLVLQCAKDTDNTFEKINELLPHRSMSEIRERFLNVMQLLQQMALQPE